MRATLRRAGRDVRRGLTGSSRRRAEERLRHHLLTFLDARPVGVLALTAAVDGEPDLIPLGETLRGRGWQLALPVVADDTRMWFARWEPGTTLAEDRYGIPTPVGAARVAESRLDVVLVPCVAVDRSGNRLGFGAGFYDRALVGLRREALTVATVFSEQVVEEVPAGDWDVRMDAVVTDAGIVRNGAAGSGRA